MSPESSRSPRSRNPLHRQANVQWADPAWAALKIGGAMFFAAGAAFAVLGTFMRYSSDDYCQAATLKEFGFWGAQVHSYMAIVGRYTFNLVSSIADLIGPSASGWIPALLMLAWLAGTLATMKLSLRTFHIGEVPGWAFYLSSAVVFLTMYQAPDRGHSLFWRSGALSYTAPIAGLWLLGGLILWTADSRKRAWWLLPVFLLALANAGFSETGAVVQLTLLAAISFLVGLTRGKRSWDPLLRSLVLALLGTAVGLAAMAMTPSTLDRLVPNSGALVVAVELPIQSLGLAVSFTRETIEGLPVPTLLAVGMGLTLGVLLGFASAQRRLRPAGAVVATLAVVLLALLAVASVYAPSLYALGYVPGHRSMLAARHALVVAEIVVGYIWGVVVSGGLDASRIRVRRVVLSGCAVLSLAFAVYGMRGGVRVLDPVRLYARWALAWDMRHAAILQSGAGSSDEVHVTELENIIPMLGELRRNPGHYYNLCAADFYGVESIAADLPGW